MNLALIKTLSEKAGYSNEYVNVCACAGVDVSGEIPGTKKAVAKRKQKLLHVVANWFLGLESQSERVLWVQGAASKLASPETGSRSTELLQGLGAVRSTTSTWRDAKKSIDKRRIVTTHFN
jgi:hypothetical protein